MTEAEWFASADPAAMGAAVSRRKRASARVLRLYLAAFWAWQSRRLDSPADRERLRQRAEWVEAWADTGTPPDESRDRNTFVFYNTNARAGFLSTVRAPAGWTDGGPARQQAVRFMHEVFGNPFATRKARKTDPRRGWMFDPAWRTDTAVLLARTMYESREFSAMPILADALQDAGCDNDDVLNHCRAPQTSATAKPARGSAPRAEHVRGCWVLDLVLDNA